MDDNSNMAKSNEIVCWRPDSTHDVLIVAPSMTFNNASGGGYYYNKLPKAVIDFTGDYILWSSNLRSDRLDIIIARVPWHLLVAPEDYNPGEMTPDNTTSPDTATVVPSQLESGSSLGLSSCFFTLILALSMF